MLKRELSSFTFVTEFFQNVVSKSIDLKESMHGSVTHALSYSEIRKENKISFMLAAPYLRQLLAQGIPCRLHLPTMPNFHVFATFHVHLKWEKKFIMLHHGHSKNPNNFMDSYLGSLNSENSWELYENDSYDSYEKLRFPF